MKKYSKGEPVPVDMVNLSDPRQRPVTVWSEDVKIKFKPSFDYFCETFEKANNLSRCDLIKTQDNRVYSIDGDTKTVIDWTETYKRCIEGERVQMFQGISGQWVVITEEVE